MKRVILATAAVLAAVAVWIALSLPPRPVALAAVQDRRLVRGVIHVHTRRSDGRSSPEDIAAAAARAGLKFVVFTDHGDGTRLPDPPVYRAGVLCVDAAEISTTGGHYLALGMAESPYPLGGEARDVVEDVHRLGGFGAAAHPDSVKPELRWREWAAPFDGLEMMNPDSSWRAIAAEPGRRPKARLISALVTYPFRPAPTIASLFTDAPALMARWESLTRRRRVVALGGVDAHAQIAWQDGDPAGNARSLPLPSYRASFETLSLYVRSDRPLSGDARADAAAILAAIRNGHAYPAVDAIASPALLEFTAQNRRGTAQAGDELIADGSVSLRIRTNAPSGFTTTIWRGDQVLSADRHERDFTVGAPPDPAVYRVEIRAARDSRGRQPLWILSNPIYVRSAAPAPGLPVRPAPTAAAALVGANAAEWRAEADAMSTAAMEPLQPSAAGELHLRFTLAGGAPAHQFAAIAVFSKRGVGEFDRLAFTARAERPMRMSAQLRAAVTTASDERWQRSVYIDTVERETTVFFDTLSPMGVTRTYRPPLADVHSIVFVIDTTNTKPGASGQLWIRNVRLER